MAISGVPEGSRGPRRRIDAMKPQIRMTIREQFNMGDRADRLRPLAFKCTTPGGNIIKLKDIVDLFGKSTIYTLDLLAKRTDDMLRKVTPPTGIKTGQILSNEKQAERKPENRGVPLRIEYYTPKERLVRANEVFKALGEGSRQVLERLAERVDGDRGPKYLPKIVPILAENRTIRISDGKVKISMFRAFMEESGYLPEDPYVIALLKHDLNDGHPMVCPENDQSAYLKFLKERTSRKFRVATPEEVKALDLSRTPKSKPGDPSYDHTPVYARSDTRKYYSTQEVKDRNKGFYLIEEQEI